MAVSAVPFALQGGSHPASLFRQAVSSVVPNAGGIVQAGDLAVTQTGTPSMGVIVGVGRAWVPGTNVANFSGTTYSSQAQYFALNDGPVTKTISAADPTNPRIDIVVLQINDAQYAGSTNDAELNVITGTPAASPTAPTAPANSLVLAQVYVAANAASIVNANITQKATAGIPRTPLAYANTAFVGSQTNLLANFTNQSNGLIIQGGTYVATTDAAGNIQIVYPQAFPNGIFTTTVCNGDHSTGTRLIFSVAGTPFTQTLSSLYCHVDDGTGAAKANTTLRFNWTAMGW